MIKIVCRPKVLTPDQEARARRSSVEINPENADEMRVIRRTPAGVVGGLRRLAVVVGRKWPKSGVRLSVQFLDNPSRELRGRILLHMNAWAAGANIKFDETNATGQVRIARLEEPEDVAGYWSYVGTEILGIEEDQPTLNLEGFTMNTPEAEFRRVVRHEAGHTLGFEHEHMREALVNKIDRRKAIAYFDRTQGWTKEETISQVLEPLSKASIMGTRESDPLSIMCYQIPGAITKDGKAIPGGNDINPRDFEFAGKVYPKAVPPRDATIAPATKTAVAIRTAGPRAAMDNDAFQIVVMDRFEPDVAKTRKRQPRPKFVRVFASYAGARVTVPMRIRSEKGDEPTRFGSIIDVHERIRNYTNRDSGSLPDDKAMIEFGSDLFETLFQGDVRRLYDEARARQNGQKLDFVFTSMIPWIAEKPWEFAYDMSRRSFLATEDVHFIRNVLTAIPADTILPREGPLRILVASAQPAGFGRLSVKQEEALIRRSFDPLIAAKLVEVVALARATPSSIHEHLRSGEFGVVHFIGHGAFDEKTQQGSLVFENADGGEFRLGERSVREIFCQRGVKLVFLNACQTGAGGRADFNKGVAQSLVSHGLPALVANQYSVLDSSATQFARHFYAALAQGLSIGKAAREARIAVNYALKGDPIDWAVPVVYARDPNMRLCIPSEAAAPPTPASTVFLRDRGPLEDRPTKIAVWDIDNVFPSLAGTLSHMNGAQNRFGFELVDLSAPIDAWDLKKKAPDRKPYLWAERLAERLERAPLELHVDVLACITRHWLRSDDDLNLYGWWPDDTGPPVVIFSCAGFDDLLAEGIATDRAIANVMVELLTGYLGQIDSHEHGPKDCPMSYNDKRDLQYITGRQVFHSACRKKLKKALPQDLPALEGLLKLFF